MKIYITFTTVFIITLTCFNSSFSHDEDESELASLFAHRIGKSPGYDSAPSLERYLSNLTAFGYERDSDPDGGLHRVHSDKPVLSHPSGESIPVQQSAAVEDDPVVRAKDTANAKKQYEGRAPIARRKGISDDEASNLNARSPCASDGPQDGCPPMPPKGASTTQKPEASGVLVAKVKAVSDDKSLNFNAKSPCAGEDGCPPMPPQNPSTTQKPEAAVASIAGEKGSNDKILNFKAKSPCASEDGCPPMPPKDTSTTQNPAAAGAFVARVEGSNDKIMNFKAKSPCASEDGCPPMPPKDTSTTENPAAAGAFVARVEGSNDKTRNFKAKSPCASEDGCPPMPPKDTSTTENPAAAGAFVARVEASNDGTQNLNAKSPCAGEEGGCPPMPPGGASTTQKPESDRALIANVKASNDGTQNLNAKSPCAGEEGGCPPMPPGASTTQKPESDRALIANVKASNDGTQNLNAKSPCAGEEDGCPPKPPGASTTQKPESERALIANVKDTSTAQKSDDNDDDDGGLVADVKVISNDGASNFNSKSLCANEDGCPPMPPEGGNTNTIPTVTTEQSEAAPTQVSKAKGSLSNLFGLNFESKSNHEDIQSRQSAPVKNTQRTVAKNDNMPKQAPLDEFMNMFVSIITTESAYKSQVETKDAKAQKAEAASAEEENLGLIKPTLEPLLGKASVAKSKGLVVANADAAVGTTLKPAAQGLVSSMEKSSFVNPELSAAKAEVTGSLMDILGIANITTPSESEVFMAETPATTSKSLIGGAPTETKKLPLSKNSDANDNAPVKPVAQHPPVNNIKENIATMSTLVNSKLSKLKDVAKNATGRLKSSITKQNSKEKDTRLASEAENDKKANEVDLAMGCPPALDKCREWCVKRGFQDGICGFTQFGPACGCIHC